MSQQQNERHPTSKGVLFPRRSPDTVTIARHPAASELDPLVRHYWIPRWSLPPGETSTQSVLQYPVVNLVINDDFAGAFGPARGAGGRELSGTGWAFGVLLRPAGGRAILGDDVAGLTEHPFPLPPELAAEVRAASADDHAMIAAFEHWLLQRGSVPDAGGERINAVVEAIENDRELVRVDQLAERFGLGVRALERLTAHYLGVSPKGVVQRYRLQEAAHALASEHPPALAELAARLGYSDQAHFTRDFTRVIGVTPARYR